MELRVYSIFQVHCLLNVLDLVTFTHSHPCGSARSSELGDRKLFAHTHALMAQYQGACGGLVSCAGIMGQRTNQCAASGRPINLHTHVSLLKPAFLGHNYLTAITDTNASSPVFLMQGSFWPDCPLNVPLASRFRPVRLEYHTCFTVPT